MLLRGEFIRFGSPLLSEFCSDNEGEQKTLLGMGFAVFLTCYLLCVSIYAFVHVWQEINLVTEV